MDAGKVRLVELINANKRTFNIPVYQRNYDWKIEQCKKLFDDLIKVHEKNRRGHFLEVLFQQGTII